MNTYLPSVVEASSRKPLLTCVITDNTDRTCIATIRNAIYDGAEAFLMDFTKLEDKYRNIDSLRKIIDYCEDKPLIMMCYRRDFRPDMTDERIAESLLMSVEAGASMVDIMGDLYHPSPLQLTEDEEAIRKQKELVEKVHQLGGEVLMSSHTWVPMTSEHTLAHARALASRGADMIKIACTATNDAEMRETFNATMTLKEQLEVPFLHVCMGQYGKLHRVIAPTMGSSMALCVQRYNGIGMFDQVLLRSTKAVYDNLDWKMARNTTYGTAKKRSCT